MVTELPGRSPATPLAGPAATGSGENGNRTAAPAEDGLFWHLKKSYSYSGASRYSYSYSRRGTNARIGAPMTEPGFERDRLDVHRLCICVDDAQIPH